MSPGATFEQINRLISHLVEAGLADDQRFAFQRKTDVIEITFENAGYVSSAMRDVSYANVYGIFARHRVFNAKLLDGAFVQMMYIFADGALRQHRLAFLPAPHLERFERDPESYDNDQMYADIVARSILPLPIRFDYDSRGDRHTDVVHPKSHLTLGEYSHCRIPVTAPLTSHRFIDFVLRNFYQIRSSEFASRLPRFHGVFAGSMTAAERRILHMTVPSGAVFA